MVFYPDNEKREQRAKELLTYCAEFQAVMGMAKEELEKKALEANQAIYNAYKALEPDMPPYHDWNQDVELTDKMIENTKIGKWVVSLGGATASIIVSTKVYQLLKPMLESANCFKGAALTTEEATAEAAAEGVGEAAAEKVGLEVAERLAPEVLEVGGVEATEVTLSLTSRVVCTALSGAGGLIAGIVVAVLIDLIADAVSGAIERSKLRTTIFDAYRAREKLKVLEMQYLQLQEQLHACVNAFEVLVNPNIISKMSKELLDKIVDNLVNQNQGSLTDITPEKARQELADLDRQTGSWTDEDTLGDV